MLFPFLLAALYCASTSQGCSRVSYDSGAADGHRIVIGRSMDWLEDTNSSIWAFPAGMQRNGHAGANSISWTSKHGSVIASVYDVATIDGMNTEGLVANGLYLADGDYGKRDPHRAGLSTGVWLQYFLDTYATVAEAKADLYTASGAEKYQVATKEVVPGVPSLCHLALTDSSGDNMIIEYLEGKLVVHQGKKYTVMTNEPSFDQQLAISEYWQPIANMSLPGTDRPADRFARLAYYSSSVPDSPDFVSAIAVTAGMVRAVSVPFKPTDLSNPNIAPTYWRTYADTKELLYFYESATDPVGIYVDLHKLDLSSSGKVMLLTLNNTWTERLGDMSGEFVASAPFEPLSVT